MNRLRRGFSLMEIIVAMTLTLAVFAITLPFVRAQTRALGSSAGRLDAEQLARYAQRAVEQDLRYAYADPGQPLLVYAGPMAISFSANALARDTTDPGAADIRAGASPSVTESWRVANAGQLPHSSRVFPTQDYLDSDGNISRVETISFFLHPDSGDGRSDIYALWRRVNAADSTRVVRGIQIPADSAFFSYYRPVGSGLQRFAAARLPLYWDSTAIDSVRMVAIRATGLYVNRTTQQETLRTVHWSMMLPNTTGRIGQDHCGPAPARPLSFSAQLQQSPRLRVELGWSASTDDNAGARDVTHYLIERRQTGWSPGNWITVMSVPATQSANYQSHIYLPLTSGSTGQHFSVRAVDCGGEVSQRSSAVISSGW